MRRPITPLRLSDAARRDLLAIAERCQASLTAVVEYLIAGAATSLHRLPSRYHRPPSLRGEEWRRARARGQASILPLPSDQDAP